MMKVGEMVEEKKDYIYTLSLQIFFYNIDDKKQSYSCLLLLYYLAVLLVIASI